MRNYIPNPKGRPKGIPNKRTLDVLEKLERISCDPVIGMAGIAMNNLPCGVCRGEGQTRYSLPSDQRPECDKCPEDEDIVCIWCSGTGIRTIGIRTCLSCYGTLFEACAPELRGKMYAELANYVLPKRKAIEMSGQLGDPDLAAILRERYATRVTTRVALSAVKEIES